MPVTPARFATCILALALCAPGVARADDKEACVAASEQAQTLKDEAKFRAQRAALLVCARDVCPSIVRRDCEKWLVDLDAVQPTVVLGARDPKGNDVPGTTVRLDGAPLLDRIDGKPIAVDPGEHVFRYEAPTMVPVEQRVVVRVGEKNRMLTVILMPPSAPPVLAAPLPVEAHDAREEAPSSGRSTPVAAWVLAGVAGVSGASFAFFGVTGQNDVANLRATCKPNCAQSDVDAARNKLIAADVSLGVGLVSLAAATWLFIRHAKSQPASHAAQLDVQPRAGGAFATISARF